MVRARFETVMGSANDFGILHWIPVLAIGVRAESTLLFCSLRMNRSDLQRLSQLRIDEAKALLAAGFPAGAYYMAGYAIECAFKACIAKRVQQYDFPDKGKVVRSYTHNLSDLMRWAELETLFEQAQQINPALNESWAIVKDWSESARYRPDEPLDRATNLIAAISDPSDGVLTWLIHRW